MTVTQGRHPARLQRLQRTAEREQALARLHDLPLRAARAELRPRSRPAGVQGRRRDDLAHQAADDALLAITSKLAAFLDGLERAGEMLHIDGGQTACH